MDPWGGIIDCACLGKGHGGVLGGAIKGPARDYLLYCLNVIVRDCGKRYYVRGVWNRDDQQVPDYKAGQV